jgi:hypothetical protein
MNKKNQKDTQENSVEKSQIFLEYSRDESGLLNCVDYIFKDDGSVDWRAMIPNEYITINKDRFKNSELPDSIDGLEDKDLLITLPGIKEVAKIRGLVSRRTRIVESSPTRAVSECEVEFIPNYETCGHKYVYSDVGSATVENTSGFGKFFLETIAANRAFVRAVRNALRIDIIGSDEVAGASYENNSESNGSSGGVKPYQVLESKAKLKSFPTFEAFRNKVIEKSIAGVKAEEASLWSDWGDIPNDRVWTFLSLLNSSTHKK